MLRCVFFFPGFTWWHCGHILYWKYLHNRPMFMKAQQLCPAAIELTQKVLAAVFCSQEWALENLDFFFSVELSEVNSCPAEELLPLNCLFGATVVPTGQAPCKEMQRQMSERQTKAQFTQDAEHLATGACKLWNTLWSMGVFTQLANNIKGFVCKFACKCAYESCVNGP